MNAISINGDANISASEDLFGLSVGDLQENVVINTNNITGTLKHVTGYTGFSNVAEEQSGNYLATHWESEGATITAQLLPDEEVVALASDGLLVLRITDKDTQTLKVTASKNGESVNKTYSLSGLTLEV